MSEYWDREVVEPRHVPWMGVEAVRVYFNRRIGGDELLWPLEWFEKWLQGRTFDRALSIGCGPGVLDRQLIQRGDARSVDAFDGSMTSLHIARKEAEAAGIADRIHYFAADFNRIVFPHSRYDLIVFHQSAHHVANLEGLFRTLIGAIKPGGIVYMDEYVGPSRWEWAIHRRRLLNRPQKLFATVPPPLRLVERLYPQIEMDDPTEAIRSSEIEPQLRVGFDIVVRRPYGGGILSVVLPNTRASQIEKNLLDQLIEHDRKAPDYYTLIVAKPKEGWRASVARARYWLEPKLKWPFTLTKRLVARLALARL